MVKKIIFILLNILACAFCQAHWELEGLEIDRGMDFKGICFPMINPLSSKVCVMIEMNRIYLGSKKFDFISINAAPEVIFEGVTIKILKLQEYENGKIWTDFIKEFSINNSIFKKGEIRGISIFSEKSGLILTGGEGHFDKNLTFLEIRTNVSIRGVQKSLRSVRVMLQGPMRGSVVWEEEGVIHVEPVA